ncbi:MAG: hypothetical protein IKB05_02725 [Alphaproteobacteria bacterium]|nr:hypothetical protein [Alphaproteobacteria bacterium]
MKKLLILTAVGAILAAPALAVQKCVALDENSGVVTYTANEQEVEWTATLMTGAKISGIGICNSTEGMANEMSYSLKMTSEDGNSYCWCKMISPVVSYWVFAENMYNDASCFFYCSDTCARYIQQNSDFRAMMYSFLTD